MYLRIASQIIDERIYVLYFLNFLSNLYHQTLERMYTRARTYTHFGILAPLPLALLRIINTSMHLGLPPFKVEDNID